MYSEDYEKGAAALEAVRIATDSITSDAELAALARAPEAKVRAAVGEQAKTPLGVLLVLATDTAPAVRAAVGRNPRVDLPLKVRETLAQDKSVEVLFGLLKCPTLPDAILARLAKSSVREVAAAAKERAKVHKTSGGAQPVFGQVGLAPS